MPDKAEREKRIALVAYEVARARMGQQAGFSALVDLCAPGLYAHARRLCDDAETARDIVQDAWVEIARSLGRLRDDRAFLAFALQIVTRMAARDLRKRQKRRLADAGFTAEQEAAPPDAQETALDLDAAIAALPRDQRITLALFHLEGLSVAEVARALDIPPGTVKTRLMKARSRLRKFLEGDQT
ncbi:MAG: RNA polymerase subunit sigma-70 [Rhodobacterales bacterium]|nr:MAG: RNA polymerase subunit sigma-70 [Rhodobacterales bacterium]